MKNRPMDGTGSGMRRQHSGVYQHFERDSAIRATPMPLGAISIFWRHFVVSTVMRALKA
jgi:hypothetical protein